MNTIAVGTSVEPVHEPLYDRMVRMGVDMSWYHKALSSKPVGSGHNSQPILCDERCCSLSIYLLKKDGTLWTINSSVEGGGTDYVPYAQVRSTGKPQPKDMLVCVHCKQPFTTVKAAQKHYKKETQ